MPKRPWQKLATDLFYMTDDSYILLVDYYSKFFEVSMLKDTKRLTEIKCLRQNFARHGIPEELLSNYGPEFSSYEFQDFAREFGFKPITSSPKYPQNNPYQALLELRNTPLPGVGLSPVQLLMGRRTKSFIPNNLPGKSFKKKLQFNQKQKYFYDRNAQDKKPLSKGDLVKIRSYQTPSSTWNPGQVVEICEEPRSYIVKSGDRNFRRNRRNLSRTKERSFHSRSREKKMK